MLSSPNRIFLGYSKPCLEAVADILITEFSSDFEVDLRHITVVVPSQRATRRLLELLLEHSEGMRLLPPKRCTVGQLPELCYVPNKPFADPLQRTLAWITALRNNPTEANMLVADTSNFSELRSCAQQLETVWNELSSVNLIFSEVRKLHPDNEDWPLLENLHNAYLKVLTVWGLSDKNTERRQALIEDRVTFDHNLRLIGCQDIPVITKQVLEKLSSLTAYIYALEDDSEGFCSLGCHLTDYWAKKLIPYETLKHITVSPRTNAREQASLFTSRLHGLSKISNCEDIRVTALDTELISLIQHQADLYNIPLHLAEGSPISEHEIFQFLQCAKNYTATRSYEYFASLVRVPAVFDYHTQHPQT